MNKNKSFFSFETKQFIENITRNKTLFKQNGEKIIKRINYLNNRLKYDRA